MFLLKTLLILPLKVSFGKNVKIYTITAKFVCLEKPYLCHNGFIAYQYSMWDTTQSLTEIQFPVIPSWRLWVSQPSTSSSLVID